MNRSELIAAVAARLDTTKGNAAQMVDTVLGVIADRLTEEREEVAIADFGRFSIKQQPERQGINPQTGEKITIEAKEKVSKEIKKLNDEISRLLKNLQIMHEKYTNYLRRRG